MAIDIKFNFMNEMSRNKKMQCPKQQIKIKCSKMDLSMYCFFSDFFWNLTIGKLSLLITYKSLRTTCSEIFYLLPTKHNLI